jgi:hypothetical protein
MAVKKSETLEFTRRYLRDKPDATFAEIRDAAAERDMKIFPIVFGRAKALEGLVQVAPYGSKKRARTAEKAEKAEKAAELSAGHAGSDTGPVTGPVSGPVDGGGGARDVSAGAIEDMISGLREHHEDRERYRAALMKISQILDEIL